jgi:hypothetical protein
MGEEMEVGCARPPEVLQGKAFQMSLSGRNIRVYKLDRSWSAMKIFISATPCERHS